MKYLICFLLLGIGLIACSQNHQGHDKLSGKALFELHCAGCHKNSGKGNFLKGVPDARYSNLTIKETIEKIRRSKQQNSKMTVFEAMPVQEAKKIVLYLKGQLKPREIPKDVI